MSPAPTILRPADYRRTPWKNGGGVTVDIADAYRPGAEPGGWAGMIWRFGRTRIAAPGPFSDLSGYDRILVVVEGRGLTLRVADGRALDAAPFRPVRFPGAWPITSELADGPVEVLNLIGAEDIVALDLSFVAEGETIMSGPGTSVAYAAGGPARLRFGDQIIGLDPDGAARAAITGSCRFEILDGTVAVATIFDRAMEAA